MEPTTFYWFLNQAHPYASPHYQPTLPASLAWRSLLAVAIDWEALLRMNPTMPPAFFKPLDVVVDDASEANEIARRQRLTAILGKVGASAPSFGPIPHYSADNVARYRVVRGSGLAVKVDPKIGKILEFCPEDSGAILDIPWSVILSSHSTGFPKVAHSPTRFLIGYRTLRDACWRAMEQGTPIAYDWSYFQPETFSPEAMRLFSIFRHQCEQRRFETPQAEINAMAMTLRRLDDLSVADMVHALATHYTPPYILYTEIGMDETVLNDANHPLIQAYGPLRKRYHLATKGVAVAKG